MSKDEINAFLGAGTEYTGKLVFQGAVRIDGVFHGEVISDGSLIVGKDALIEGKIEVGELILSGYLNGQVLAKKRVTVHRGGKLVGEINTPGLAVEDGAIIHGTIVMDNDAEAFSGNYEKIMIEE